MRKPLGPPSCGGGQGGNKARVLHFAYIVRLGFHMSLHSSPLHRASWLVLLLATIVAPSSSAQIESAPRASLTTPTLSVLEIELKAAVYTLAEQIGERNLNKPKKLDEARDWILTEWKLQGLKPDLQTYLVNGQPCSNIEVVVTKPKPGPLLVIGSHYDSVRGSPGADDNASGVAALVQISKALAGLDLRTTVKCVAFVNEEPPYFDTDEMGSRVYAKAMSGRGEKVLEMISIESIGYYSDSEDSQRYPPLLSYFYPSVGNFIGVVGSIDHPESAQRLSMLLRTYMTVPVETAILPADLIGVSWSDHASFWRYGFTGVMVTDTAPFRNADYHRWSDLPGTLDYPRFARVTLGLILAVHRLAQAPVLLPSVPGTGPTTEPTRSIQR